MRTLPFYLPLSHFHNFILTHLHKQFLMPLNDALPARFLCLFNYLVFNLLLLCERYERREREKLIFLIEMNCTNCLWALAHLWNDFQD